MALRVGDGFDRFGRVGKAGFPAGLPASLTAGGSTCCRVVLPTSGQSLPPMTVVNPLVEPPRIDYLAREDHLLYPHYAIGLSRGYLLNAVGHVADADGLIYAESMRDRYFLQDRLYPEADLLDPAYRQDLAARIATAARPMPGRYFSLVYGLGHRNWYHWLIENLGRLVVVGALPDWTGLKIIIPADLSAARRGSLAALGLGPERLIEHDGGIWACEELWLPSFGAVRGSLRSEPVEWLRRTFAGALGPGPKPFRRLFISRGDAAGRRLVNESEVLERLGPLGFQRVTLEGLPFDVQARLFREAAVVISPHSAALANLLFVQPGSLVLELLGDRADGSVLTVYHTLAHYCEARYVGVRCRELDHASADFVIEPGLLPVLLHNLIP